MTKLKFTIIGLGHIGKRHAGIIAGLPDSELEIVGVKSEEVRMQSDLLVNSEELRIKSDLLGKSEEVRMKSEELPADSKLLTLNSSLLILNSKLLPLNSIAAICTPNNLHCTQAIEWMQKGCDVIIEKPMGLNAAECREVIEVARKLERKVFCVMQNRYSPPAAWLKELIGSGRLGKIYSVQVNCLWNRNKAYYEQSTWKGKLAQDGGTLFTQFSHFVDTVLWLFGDIEPVSAQFFNHNHPYIEFEDSGVVNAVGVKSEELRMNSDGVKSEEVRVKSPLNSSLLPLNSESALNSSLLPLTSESTLNSSLLPLNSFPIQINYSTSAYGQNLESSITILAENGTVKVGGQYMDKVLACEVKDYEMPELEAIQPPNDYGHYKGSASNHAYVYQNVIDVLAGKADIACTAEEGLKVVEFIEKVYTFRVKS
jgi:predicted dehydrogenase